MACIAGGGGIAREMFVRVHWANDRFAGTDSAPPTPPLHSDSYLNNDHLPLGPDVSVAVLLVGELRSFALTAPWLQANVISSIGTDSVDVFAAVRPLPAAAAGAACTQVRSGLSNVVSCHEVPTITGAQNVTLFHFGMLAPRHSLLIRRRSRKHAMDYPPARDGHHGRPCPLPPLGLGWLDVRRGGRLRRSCGTLSESSVCVRVWGHAAGRAVGIGAV